MTTTTTPRPQPLSGTGSAWTAMLCGVVLAATALSDRYLWFVRPSYRWPLLATAAVLLIVGAAALIHAATLAANDHTGGAAAPDCHHHTTKAPPAALWLAIAGAAVIAIGATGPVTGALSAGKPLFAGTERTPVYKPLPTTGVPSVPLHQITGRLRAGQTLDGRTIDVVGRIEHRTDGATVIWRMQMTCCASDATRTTIPLRADDAAALAALPTGTWVNARAVAQRVRGGAAQLDARTITATPAPSNPYEM